MGRFDLWMRGVQTAGAVVALAASTITTGCAGDPATPRMRLGSLPFPGAFTLYAVADPRRLGAHRYEEWWETHDGPDETDRGILYTTRAGFLDLSHVRESIDITKYTHDRIEQILHTGASGSFTMEWSDTHYEVDVRLPAWWKSIGAAERRAIVEEASIREAQRLAIIIGAWHELGTWYGQQTIPLISEKNSAFTWDDSASHVVAAIVAGRALRDSARWNCAVTEALDRELGALGVVDVECEAKAVEAVQGRWWKNGAPLRRDLDTGLLNNVKMPWLVMDLDCAGPASTIGSPLVIDDMHFGGRDLAELFEVRIVPEKWLMHAALGCDACPRALVGESELLAAIERVRADVKKDFGPESDRP